MTITAKIIADSISEAGVRITTMELEYPRFIHSQFMTHRMFSRNAQSSRAIPTSKQIELIKESLALNFSENKAGMQAGGRLNFGLLTRAIEAWEYSKKHAIEATEELLNLGVHKQWANRLLEPFATIKVVVTATEWNNFFNLRLHHDAQPEIQELARAMKSAMDESRPDTLDKDAFHVPYISDLEYESEIKSKDLLLISAARCARVSYLNHDNTNPDIEKDLELANRLLKDGHLSPFEHQAKPMKHAKHSFESGFGDLLYQEGATHVSREGNNFSFAWSNNFRGWIQHRALLS